MNPAIATLAPPSLSPPLVESPARAVVLPRSEDVAKALFAEIYQNHLPIMWKTARAFATNRQDQEDLVQSILWAVWDAIDTFQHRAKLSTYVYRIATNHALNWKRSERRYWNKISTFEKQIPELQLESSDPQTEARLAWLYRAINRLRPVDRTICLLYLDGKSYIEMSEILGLPQSTITIRIHRCKQQLMAIQAKDNE